jgi:hypothetical protein
MKQRNNRPTTARAANPQVSRLHPAANSKPPAARA